MSAYTPGPWGIQEGKTLLHIETFESERADGSLDTRTAICSVPKKHYANARLIAAAPELLELCRLAMIELEALGHTSIITERCRAAIAKATEKEAA